jgi:hypothetical protein
MWNGNNGFPVCDTVLRNYIPALHGTDMLPLFRDYTQQMANLFGSTYIYEHLSSKMKVVEGKFRNRLWDGIFESCC